MSVQIFGKGKKVALQRRHARLRKRISGTPELPRLVVINALLTATIVMAKVVWMVTMVLQLAMHLTALVNGLNNLNSKILA